MKQGRHAACEPSVLPARAVDRLVRLVKAGGHGELERETRRLLLDHPDSGLLWKILGWALWMQGKDALECLGRAAQLLPEDAEAHANLGNAFRACGQADKAIACHGRALEIKPDYAAAHNDLGSALQDLGRLDEALSSFRNALALRPDFALAHSNVANALMLQNRPNDAEDSCRMALQIEPNLTMAIVQLAELQAGRGQFPVAAGLLQHALSIEPDMPEAWSGLVRWRKMTAADVDWLTHAQRIVARPLPPRREAHLRFALGKYFDDLADYEQAFDNFRRANELAGVSGLHYDRVEMARGVGRIIACHDREWIERNSQRYSAAGAATARPVFIVGMWRSGTTLAGQLLASHSGVSGAGELDFWPRAAASYARSLQAGVPSGTAMAALANDYSSLLRTLAPDAVRVIDKMCANFLHLGLIHTALPRARIIHLSRNPLDTCLSIYFQHFQNTHPFANDLEDIAHYYAQYLRVMGHWRSALPEGAILEVPYERLVAEPAVWTRTMLEFIGLPWSPRSRDEPPASTVVSTFSKWQVRQAVHTSSVHRWRRYERFIGPLRPLTALVSDGPITMPPRYAPVFEVGHGSGER